MTKTTTVYRNLAALISAVGEEGEQQASSWARCITRPGFQKSALNLAHYMSCRRRDLRPLQRQLTARGLSSLGRLESRVMPTLVATKAALAALEGLPAETRPTEKDFFAGERHLTAAARQFFGPSAPAHDNSLLVTCPSEAATEPVFMMSLAQREVQAIRINCAHDDRDQWARMIGHARAAEKSLGWSFKIFMDLAGPKIRTGKVQHPKHSKKIATGDTLAVTRPGGMGGINQDAVTFVVECSAIEVLDAAKIGDRMFIDDGKLSAQIEAIEPWGLLARLTAAPAKGAKLKEEKGLNFPDTEFTIPALTDKDLLDLDFVAENADGVGLSFVQTADDVRLLQDALTQRRPRDWKNLSLILKIETGRAVDNLPDILVQAAGSQPTAIMIARGDLAVEIGFARTAEMQEEILWIGEAAHIPVIWATQVLESLVQTGVPSRGDMTDAAMAARAECVMLNKGPYLLQAIDQLQLLLNRMSKHQHKKSPQMRRLQTW